METPKASAHWRWPWRKAGNVVRIALVICMAAAVGLMALFLYANRGELWHYLQMANYRWLLVAFGCYTLDLVWAGLGWAWLMRRLTGQGPWLSHLRIYCVSNVGRRLPGTLWYVAGRAALYHNLDTSVGVVSLASGVEFVLITAAALVTALLTLPFGQTRQVWISGFMVIGLGLALVSMHPRVIRWALQRLGKPDRPDLRYRETLVWLCWYVGVWVGGGILLFSVIQAVKPMPLQYLPVAIGAWALDGVVSTLFFFLPSGFGATELSLTFLLSAILPVTLAVGVALFMRLLVTFFEMLWALAAWIWLRVAS
jgi:uncharacterized membrane protein YbhN (UPF0104 family)